MKIGIDASSLEGEKTGVRRYLSNILEYFPEVAPQHEYILYFRKGIPDLPWLNSKCFKKRIVSGIILTPNKYTWYLYDLGLATRKDKPDVLFLSSYRIPWLVPGKTKKVVTIHDISFKVYPEWSNLAMRIGSKIFSEWGLRSTKSLITVSEFSKEEIVEYYNTDPGKIEVTYEGIDSALNNRPTKKDVPKGFDLSAKTILYVGSIFDRRHVPELIEAFSNLYERDKDIQLIIVGKNKTNPRIDIDKLIYNSGVKERIIWHKYVSDQELSYLYSRASVFVYPSSYEGFGLPPLEAMSLGVPVIYGRGSSLSEVVGDAGLDVDAVKPKEIEKKIYQLLTDNSLRELMVERGKRRAAEYSWRKCASQTVDILESL